jgi:hypothetical protein
VQTALDKIPLQRLASQTKFRQRTPKKLSPRVFIKSAILLCTQSHVSLTVWAVLIGLLTGQTVSKQAIFERLSAEAVDFLKAVLARMVLPAPPDSTTPLAGALKAFPRILVQDSTTVKLTHKLAGVFAGGANQHGKTPGVLRLQGVLDLVAQRWLHFGLSSYVRNDQKASPDILPQVRKDDLILRDLGYFALPVLRQIGQLGAFFLSRYYFRTAVFDPKGQPLNLLRLLRAQSVRGVWDGWVRLGKKELLPVRLVARRVPAPVAAERRRKARAHLKNRCQLSKEYLALQEWTIYVTNLPASLLSAQQVAALYGQRWHIEIAFKAWKSHFQLERLTGQISKEQLEAVIYGKLIFIALIQPRLFAPGDGPRNTPDSSPLKRCLLLSEYFLILFLEAERIPISAAFALQWERHGCYEKRKRRHLFQSLISLT